MVAYSIIAYVFNILFHFFLLFHSGKYECHAINAIGEESCSVDVFVQPPEYQSVGFDGSPMFLNRTQTTVADIGDSISFMCTITGTPAPKVC